MIFDLSFEGYLNWINDLRAAVREDPCEHNVRRLAEIMNLCIVQSDRDEAEKHGLLMEGIYWHLHLYYAYGNPKDLERAESIDSYRNFGMF